MRSRSFAADTGSQGIATATAVAAPAMTQASSASWTNDLRRTGFAAYLIGLVDGRPSASPSFASTARGRGTAASPARNPSNGRHAARAAADSRRVNDRPNSRPRLGEILLARGLITEGGLRRALE